VSAGTPLALGIRFGVLGGILAALVVAGAPLIFARAGSALSSYAACLIVMYAVFVAMRSAAALDPALGFAGRFVPGIAASTIGALISGAARYAVSGRSAGGGLGPALALAGTVGFFGLMTALYRLWRRPPRRAG
jgi:hypothetical protein